jgi:predicted dehydrogenase
VKSHYKTVPIIDLSTGETVDPAYPKTAPDHVFIQGVLKNEALALSHSANPPQLLTKWISAGISQEPKERSSSPPKRGNGNLGSLRSGNHDQDWKEGRDEKFDFMSGDVSKAAKVLHPAPNAARLDENFATEGGEAVTFEDALKTHRLLERIARAAGLEL